VSAVIDGSFCVAGGGDGQQPLSHLVLKMRVENLIQDGFQSSNSVANSTFLFCAKTTQHIFNTIILYWKKLSKKKLVLYSFIELNKMEKSFQHP